MFKTEQEYKAFLIWALEGSTIGQRMQATPTVDNVPDYWERFKSIADRLPSTLTEFNDDTDDTTDRTPDPINPTA